jgi:hypothetical protein
LVFGLRLGGRGGTHRASGGFRVLRARQREAHARGEVGERLIGERVHLRLLDSHVRHVERIASHPGAPRGLGSLFFHHLRKTAERIAAAADGRHHASRHFVDLGHRLLHAHVVDRALEAFDLGARRVHGDIACLDEILVGLFGLLELGAILGELALDRLQAKRILPGGGPVAGPQVRRDLGA